jgi:hydrogenase maturation protein HypF
MMLEEAAGDVACDPYATFPSEPRAKASGPRIIDWEPLIRAIVEDRDRGEDLAVISARFHESLAAIASAIAEGTHTVVLTGGCFQNLRLATRVRERLERAGHVVYSPREYPPNDGGIALGQAFVATERWKERA